MGTHVIIDRHARHIRTGSYDPAVFIGTRRGDGFYFTRFLLGVRISIPHIDKVLVDSLIHPNSPTDVVMWAVQEELGPLRRAQQIATEERAQSEKHKEQPSKHKERRHNRRLRMREVGGIMGVKPSSFASPIGWHCAFSRHCFIHFSLSIRRTVVPTFHSSHSVDMSNVGEKGKIVWYTSEDEESAEKIICRGQTGVVFVSTCVSYWLHPVPSQLTWMLRAAYLWGYCRVALYITVSVRGEI